MSTYRVKVYDLTKREDILARQSSGKKRRKTKPKVWRVRWLVGAKRFEESFVTKALGDQFRNDLLNAIKKGEAFDEESGLPASMVKQLNQTSWYAHVRKYMQMKWPTVAANSRGSIVEGLVTVTVALVRDKRGMPEVKILREALMKWAFRPPAWSAEPSAQFAKALAWMEKNSVPLVRLAEPEVVRAGLTACGTKLDGGKAAPNYLARKRTAFYNALEYAVELQILEFNPISRVKRRRRETSEQVDPRVVGNTAQVEAILVAAPDVTRNGGQYVAHFGNQYYCAMRPSESANLRLVDCYLPAHCLDCGLDLTHIFGPGELCTHERQQAAWGRIVLAETNPYAGSNWTDDGQSHERRGLKHRPAKQTRPVPAPPEQVALLRRHVRTYGLAEDGRFFRGERGGPLSYSTCDRIWKLARAAVLTPEQAASPLLGSQYDLRHAALTMWLNNGVPATEAARRAGQSVKVLLAIYAGCIDGDEELINSRISTALARGRSPGDIRGHGRSRRRKIRTYTQVKRLI